MTYFLHSSQRPMYSFGGFILFAAFAILSGSCKKNSSSANKPVNNSYLASVRNYSPMVLVIDSFSYDNTHRLTAFGQYNYDTSGGYPVTSTLIAVFGYSGTSQIPSYYTMEVNGNSPEMHTLYYDGQSRIAKDTILGGNGFVTYYSYPGNSIASTVLFEGSMTDNQIDTQFVSNGNVIAKNVYISNSAGTADDLQGSLVLGHSSDINPCYHAGIAATIGPLLDILSVDGFGGYGDYISANAVSSESGFGIPSGAVVNFQWTKDKNGRATNLSTSFAGQPGNSGGNMVFTYY